VDSSGYEWTSADEGSSFVQPDWRFRPPWNAADTPHILLQPFSLSGLDASLTAEELCATVRKNSRDVHPTDDDGALFRNFARLEPTKEAIAEFANRYGLLWSELPGVPFGEWEFEIRTMQFLVGVWDAALENDKKFLSQHFRPDQRGRFLYPYPDTIACYCRYGSAPPSEVHDIIERGGRPSQVARHYVINAINSRLAALGANVGRLTKESNFRLTIQPRSLLGALWLQFAESIGTHKSFRKCEVCGRYMEISPDVNRADRRFCSDACRNRALRYRRKVAQQMREDGETLREISKATGSDMDTIKQWLKPKGK